METIITILNSTTETSMPFNEFVIWRARHYREQRQVLIVCDKKGVLPQVDIPVNVEIVRCSKKLSSIKNVIKETVKQCENEKYCYAIHLHQVESGLLSQLTLLGTGLRKKILFTTHNTFSGYPFHNKVRSYINGLFAHYVSVVSNSAYAEYPRSLKYIKGNRIIPIQNGVDTERIDNLLVSSPQKHEGRIIFVYVARMVPVKNHGFLLDVLKKVKNTKVCFEFIGAKDENIEKRVKEEGLSDRVIMTGLIPRNEVFRKLQEAHYYISSSVLEGLPVSLLEGMYVGLPAIVSDIPQHAEISSDSPFISLLPLDVDLWVKNINDMTSLPITDIIERGKRAKKYVKENFSLERMHHQYDEIYNKIF